MRVEEDHRTGRPDPVRLRRPDGLGRRAASHASAAATAASTSPTILAVPAMQPKTSLTGASGGTSFATVRPFLVITTGIRYFRTSSITRRHRALNSPAGMVRMVASVGSWSRTCDHDSTGCRRLRADRASSAAGVTLAAPAKMTEVKYGGGAGTDP